MKVEVNSDDHGIIQLIQQETGCSESEAVSLLVEFALIHAITKGSFFKRLRFQRKLDKHLDKYPNLVPQLKAVWSLE